MIRDKTWCANRECRNIRCERHYYNAPNFNCLSWAEFKHICGQYQQPPENTDGTFVDPFGHRVGGPRSVARVQDTEG